jgi:hypothetical protein
MWSIAQVRISWGVLPVREALMVVSSSGVKSGAEESEGGVEGAVEGEVEPEAWAETGADDDVDAGVAGEDMVFRGFV